MFKCLICKRLFSSPIGLSLHIRRCEKMSISEYYDKLIKTDERDGLCHTCGNPTKFGGLQKGYRKYCSYKCSATNPNTRAKAIKTCLTKYGTENPFQNLDIQKKQRNTIETKYGEDHYSKTAEYKTKYKQTSLNRYGVDNPAKSKEVRDKYKETCIRKYGVDNINKLDKIKKQKIETCLKNHSVEHPMQSEAVKLKSKQTSLEHYGVDHPMKSDEVKGILANAVRIKYGVNCPFMVESIKKKIKETNIRLYGDEYPIRTSEIKERAKATNLERYGVEWLFYSEEFQKLVLKNKQQNFIKKLFSGNRLNHLISPNFKESEFIGCEPTYSWICNKCGHVFDGHLHDGNIPRCIVCYPPLFGSSNGEIEVASFVKSLGIIIETNNRTILNGKELDIYIPYHNLAIEFDGIYWHSELNETPRNYHLNKTIECQKQGIQLIHVFEDEWLDKPEIVKSVIRSKLGLCDRIYARKCKVSEIPNDEANQFLFDNHLQGVINGKHIGLYHNNQLVSMLTYGIPRFNKQYDIEILRFCTKLNHTVVGGLSKLLTRLKGSIISYADRRYGEGLGYKKCGFSYIQNTQSSYYYLKNHQRHNRLQFQKHLLQKKLEIFDPNLTEWQNMQLNGYDRIWDCGTNVYGRSI